MDRQGLSETRSDLYETSRIYCQTLSKNLIRILQSVNNPLKPGVKEIVVNEFQADKSSKKKCKEFEKL